MRLHPLPNAGSRFPFFSSRWGMGGDGGEFQAPGLRSISRMSNSRDEYATSPAVRLLIASLYPEIKHIYINKASRRTTRFPQTYPIPN